MQGVQSCTDVQIIKPIMYIFRYFSYFDPEKNTLFLKINIDCAAFCVVYPHLCKIWLSNNCCSFVTLNHHTPPSVLYLHMFSWGCTISNNIIGCWSLQHHLMAAWWSTLSFKGRFVFPFWVGCTDLRSKPVDGGNTSSNATTRRSHMEYFKVNNGKWSWLRLHRSSQEKIINLALSTPAII